MRALCSAVQPHTKADWAWLHHLPHRPREEELPPATLPGPTNYRLPVSNNTAIYMTLYIYIYMYTPCVLHQLPLYIQCSLMRENYTLCVYIVNYALCVYIVNYALCVYIVNYALCVYIVNYAMCVYIVNYAMCVYIVNYALCYNTCAVHPCTESWRHGARQVTQTLRASSRTISPTWTSSTWGVVEFPYSDSQCLVVRVTASPKIIICMYMYMCTITDVYINTVAHVLSSLFDSPVDILCM